MSTRKQYREISEEWARCVNQIYLEASGVLASAPEADIDFRDWRFHFQGSQETPEMTGFEISGQAIGKVGPTGRIDLGDLVIGGLLSLMDSEKFQIRDPSVVEYRGYGEGEDRYEFGHSWRGAGARQIDFVLQPFSDYIKVEFAGLKPTKEQTAEILVVLAGKPQYGSPLVHAAIKAGHFLKQGVPGARITEMNPSYAGD
ncbi:MAG: hypothetical protein V1820_03955 [archaeon]